MRQRYEGHSLAALDSPRIPHLGVRHAKPIRICRIRQDTPARFRVPRQVGSKLVKVLPLGAIWVPGRWPKLLVLGIEHADRLPVTADHGVWSHFPKECSVGIATQQR